MSLPFDVDRVRADLLATSPFEWVATVLGVIYILLVMRRNRLGWIAGGASSLILMLLAVKARLPMQGLLQFSYVLLAVYGWMSWRRPADSRPIGLWSLRNHLLVIAACVLLALAAAPMLRGSSDWPFLDPFIAALGLFASWLTVKVKLENWIYWIVIDTVSLYLFTAQGHPVIALLFLLYLGISCTGFFSWWRTWKRQAA